MRFWTRVGYHDHEVQTDSFDEHEHIVTALDRNRALICTITDSPRSARRRGRRSS